MLDTVGQDARRQDANQTLHVRKRLSNYRIGTPARYWIPAVIQHRDLLVTLVVRDIKTRYQQSLLGLYWAVIEPLATAIVLSVVFSMIVRVPTGTTPYVVFLLSGLLPWTFFANAINSGAVSVVRNPSLITKIYFPREILPVGAVLARLFDFAISMAILLGIMLWYGILPSLGFLLLPAVLALHLSLCLGIALVVSAANVFYRDVGQLLGIVLMLWMYLSPVLYPADMVPHAYRQLFALNPMQGILDAYRATLLGSPWPGPANLAYTLGFSVVCLALGYAFFKRGEPLFADVV